MTLVIFIQKGITRSDGLEWWSIAKVRLHHLDNLYIVLKEILWPKMWTSTILFMKLKYHLRFESNRLIVYHFFVIKCSVCFCCFFWVRRKGAICMEELFGWDLYVAIPHDVRILILLPRALLEARYFISFRDFV